MKVLKYTEVYEEWWENEERERKKEERGQHASCIMNSCNQTFITTSSKARTASFSILLSPEAKQSVECFGQTPKIASQIWL